MLYRLSNNKDGESVLFSAGSRADACYKALKYVLRELSNSVEFLQSITFIHVNIDFDGKSLDDVLVVTFDPGDTETINYYILPLNSDFIKEIKLK